MDDGRDDRVFLITGASSGIGAATARLARLQSPGVRVTLIEPGMVDTPFFDDPKPDALRPEDIARSVLFALRQPPGVDVHELTVLPTPPKG